ncbi:MAG: hypothetical protein WBP58_15150 [Chitinophagaceae bacterium]
MSTSLETVTVDEAIAKGQRMVNYPVFGILIGVLGLTIYLVSQHLIPFWGLLIGFVVAIGVSWLWWSVMITKWRIWAFENVRNVHELKKRAIQEKLIWKDDSIFENTEIRNQQGRAKWVLLQEKFKREDVFMDDLTIAKETVIYYSKWKNLGAMAFMLSLMGGGIYLIVEGDQYIMGVIASILGTFYSVKSFRAALNTKAQIIIGNTGIETFSTRFYPWDEIENEVVRREGFGSSTSYYLNYDHPAGAEHLLVDELDTDHRRLSRLLMVYRGRSERNKTNG